MDRDALVTFAAIFSIRWLSQVARPRVQSQFAASVRVVLLIWMVLSVISKGAVTS